MLQDEIKATGDAKQKIVQELNDEKAKLKNELNFVVDEMSKLKHDLKVNAQELEELSDEKSKLE